MAGLRKFGIACLSLVTLLVVQLSTAVGSPVEELARRLPDNTIGFVATSGGDALKGDFEKSSMGRIVNDPNARSFVGSIWTQIQTKIAAEADDANETKDVMALLDSAALFARRPIMVAVAQTQVTKGPPIWGFGVVDAGEMKPQLSEAIAKLESHADKDEIVEVERASVKVRAVKDGDSTPLYWGWVGNYLVVAVNDEQGLAIQCVSKPRATVPDIFRKVPGTDDAMVIHYDLQKIGRLVGPLIAEESKGEFDPNMIVKALAGLGLDKITGLTARLGFSGADLVSDELIEVPEPRTGLLAAFKPVDPSLLGLVDPNAMEVSIVNCDPAAIYDAIVNTIRTVSPDEAYPEFQNGLAKVESELKINIRKDLLGAMGGPAVFYALPAGKMVELPMGGYVAVMKMKDAALFEKTMISLGKYISTQAGGGFQVSDMNDGSTTTHVWSIPALVMMQVMPAWSVTGDTVVIASSTTLHQMQVKCVASRARRPKSLLDTDGYKRVAAQLPKNPITLTYVDSQVQFGQMMTGLQQFWPIMTMMIAKEGVTLPVMLPNLDATIKQMRPGCRYAYFDAAGLHFRYQGSGVEASLSGAAGGALAMGILMPALARTRQLAFRMTSGSNLSALGKACLIYANDHNDKFPPDLETLVKEEGVTPKTLESKLKPNGFPGPSFVYIAGQTTNMQPDNIVAYENPEFCTEGVNVLFVDSHVEFVKPEPFRKQLAETCKRLGRKMPTIRFKGEDDTDETENK